jgi:hypothetical protein
VAGSPVIQAFLAELNAALRPELGNLTERAVAEAEDHLSCVVEELSRAGYSAEEASRRAVASFGTSPMLKDSYKGGFAMPSRFTRLSGLAGIVGLPLLVIGLYGMWGHLPTDAPLARISRVFIVPGVPLTLLSFAGVFARHRGRFGRLGILAVAMMAGGYAAMTALGWAAGPVAPIPVVGFILLGYSVYRADVRPRGACALLALGIVLAGVRALLGLTPVAAQAAPALVIAAGWVWLTYALWSERAIEDLSLVA